MGRLHIRLDPPLLERIERSAAVRGTTRTRVIVELIEQGMQANQRTIGAVHDSLEGLATHLDSMSQLLTEAAATFEQRDKSMKELLGGRLDRLMRVGIESVMILRRLAQAQNPQLLLDAQSAARELVRERVGGNGASDRGETDSEQRFI